MAATDGPLFSTDLISPEVLKALPEGYGCRPLEKKDYANGFLDVLRVLTTVGDITEEVYKTTPLPPLLPTNTPTAMEQTLRLDVRPQRRILPPLHNRLLQRHRRHRRPHRRAQVHPPTWSRRPH